MQVYFAGMTETIEYIRAGKIRPLAVTSTGRAEAFPDLPTLAEFVPGYESNLWFGLGAPSKTPPEIIDKLNREINAGLADSKIKARYAELGSNVLPISPIDFGKLLIEETKKWAKVVKFSGAKPD